MSIEDILSSSIALFLFSVVRTNRICWRLGEPSEAFRWNELVNQEYPKEKSQSLGEFEDIVAMERV